MKVSDEHYSFFETLTASSIADDGVECGHEIGHDRVGIVQSSEDGENVGAWVGVLLAEGSI